MGWALNKELEAPCFFGETSLVFAEAFLYWRECRQEQWFPGGFAVPTLPFKWGKCFFCHSVQFSSVAHSCPTLCDPMDFTARQASLSITNFWSLLKLMSIESVMPSNHLILYCPFFSCLQSFPASAPFPVSQFFTSGGQNTGASASASVLPMNIQDWLPLGLTGLIDCFAIRSQF